MLKIKLKVLIGMYHIIHKVFHNKIYSMKEIVNKIPTELGYVERYVFMKRGKNSELMDF